MAAIETGWKGCGCGASKHAKSEVLHCVFDIVYYLSHDVALK